MIPVDLFHHPTQPEKREMGNWVKRFAEKKMKSRFLKIELTLSGALVMV